MLWEPRGCWCFSRRTGSLIIGTLMLILSLGVIVLLNHGVVTVEVNEIIRGGCDQHHAQWQHCHTLLTYIVDSWIATYMVVAIHHVMFSSMLIHGTRKIMPCLMVPHMTVKLIGIIFIMVSVVVGTVFLIIAGAWIAVIIFIIFYVFWIFLETYFLLVLRAHYLDMKRSVSEINQVLLEDPNKDYSTFQSNTFKNSNVNQRL